MLQTARSRQHRPLDPPGRTLAYSLPDFGVRSNSSPPDFTQVNAGLNAVLVSARDRIPPAGAGRNRGRLLLRSGNFTLPIAHRAPRRGVEAPHAVTRPRRMPRAMVCGVRPLAAVAICSRRRAESIEPGSVDNYCSTRPEGAIVLVKALPQSACRASSSLVAIRPLARDAAVLGARAWLCTRCRRRAKMFPHTAHVESIALFVRGASPGLARSRRHPGGLSQLPEASLPLKRATGSRWPDPRKRDASKRPLILL